MLAGMPRSVRAPRVLLATLAVVVLWAGFAGAQGLPPFNTGRLYRTEAEFQAAVRPYRAALAANPSNARAHYWLGYAHVYAYRQYALGLAPYARNFLPPAIDSLREAVRLDPGFLDAYLVLHDALTLAGRKEEAAAVAAALLQRLRPSPFP